MKKKSILFLFVILFVGWTYSTQFLQANSLPDTGITQCFNQSQMIACPQVGDPFYGQDAHYSINPHQFVKFDSDGNALTPSASEWTMVLDQATGLMWDVKKNNDSLVDRSRQVTWYSSDPDLTLPGEAGKYNNMENTEYYIKALNMTQFGGFSDWRLPDIMELKTIVKISSDYPATYTQYFPLSQDQAYWTSQTQASSVAKAWCVHFYDGHEETQEKGDLFYVRAVRSIYKDNKASHLFINNDNTVTDVNTGLMWQRKMTSAPQPWEYALENCENSTDAGYNDWRLPTLFELQSIVNYNRITPPLIDPTVFPNTPNTPFWTSTPSQQTGHIYQMNFNDGFSQLAEAQNEHYYRSVRGGQAMSSELLSIQSPSQGRAYTIGSTLTITWASAGSGDYVRIEISRQAGQLDTFEMITDSTENDGQYEWEVLLPASVNCVIRIIPLQQTDRQNSVGLFSIVDTQAPFISNIPATSTLINQASHSIEYTINDTDGGPLMVIAESSNQDLIPLENIYLGYNSPYYVAVFESQYFYDPQYLTITPATGKSGTATITLTVYDCGFLSQQSSFQISVGDMRNALIHLFEQTEGDQWYDKSGWKTPPLSSDGFGMPQSECKWEGITCDSYGQVIHIELDTNNLTGPIPADIGNLKSLVKLNFSNNQLSGEIPANLSLLSSLQELRLDHNVLTGSVPGQIFQLSNLQILQLNHNQLSGNLDGTISQMQSLLSLNISHNQLTGGFPQSILSLYNLQHLDISQNYLTGLIPQGLSGMSYLQVLNISGNQFSGNLPSDIINLSMLSDHQSDFRYNQLTTQEQSLADFISLKQIDNDDWQSTQTLVPTNLNVLNTTDDIIHFKWIPVDYTIHDGGYEICCAKYVGGDYENCKIVNNKLTASYEMPGFKPETNYYCQIRSFTLPHTDNPNQLYSDFSSPLSATTQEEEIIWNTMESKSTNWLNGIWGTSSENVFVVGNDSTILHFDGADWLSMTSTTQQNLHHVYGLSETDIVAVGAEGTMLHYNGSNWENQQSLANIFLWALWGQDNIMYAVGNDGTILKRTNDIWEQESSNTNHDLKAIWGSSLNDIFVVGEQGTILHYTGTTWNQIDSYTNTNVDLRCVYGFSNNDVYAGGYQGTVLHYNGTKWSTVNIGDTNHIMDIWGSNEERVFAVGYQGSIFYYDGTIWTKMESGTTNPLRSIWGHSTSDVFTVGYDGTILRLGSSAPFISVITPQYTYVNIVKQIQFTIRSTMTPPDKLGLTARSTDSDLIPWDSEHLYFQGMSGTRYLFVKPAYDHYGETDIIVTVKSPNGLTATSQFHMTVHNQIIIPTEERQALEALYQSTNGHSWANKENWLGDLSTECTWYGVVCENNEHVIKISLPENELSGTITPDLGNIRYLRELDLHGNQLTGVLPKNLGDLTHLDVIDLSDNMLSGSLPDEWGRIQGLLHLKLNNNQLSGNIPSAIGSMQYLQSILFNSNKLSGIIPEQIKRLSYIKDGQSDFRYNALYTNDDSVKSFVDNIQQDRDWESTQTIAPYTICFNDVAAYSVSLSWNEISYSLNAGGYEVFYTDDPDCLSNHPENVVYRVTGPTSSKKDTTIVVTGLLPETTYYFKLRSLTAPHAYNANTVYSEFSDITFVTTKDPATLPLWKNGSFESKFVNWSYDNSFQVIESGQSIGSQWDQFFSIQAMEGNFVAVHANSGLSGTAQLSQELYIPAGGAELSFYYRLGWDLTSGNATQPRQFKMTIYPENSDNPLETHLIKEMYPNTKTKDTGEISESIDVSNYACQTIRMAFELYSPEQNSNLSFLLLDNVSLTAQYSKVLDIFLPDNVTEGDGILVNAGKIQLPKALQDDLAIHLISSTSSIIIPYQVIVPGGQKEAFFNIGISDDTVINGLRLVTISIDDAEWASCGQTMWLYDNDDAWQTLDSGTQNHLYSVWGRSSNDIFAVGRSGEIIHFDGSIWESMKSDTQSDLHAIWGDENQLYAVGDDGTILSYENNNWIKIDTSSQTHLTGIWGG
jgi:Leucine-rich repeat (LRR) protein